MINNDVIHPPQMTNEVVEDHPLVDTASSESNPSNFVNGVHRSEAVQSPTNIIKNSLDESHSDLLSIPTPDLVNGTCSATEYSKATSTAADPIIDNNLGMSLMIYRPYLENDSGEYSFVTVRRAIL